jgi:Retrotransposon gag protein
MPLNLKPAKPGSYEGKRDSLTVETWLYQVEQYLALVQVGAPETPINDVTKISYASSLFTQTAATWWYMLVQTGIVPGSWEAFKVAVRTEFVPQDSSRRARDRLRKLYQKRSVASYISEFRNIALTIPGITEEEQLDRFCEGLKPEIKLEVLKGNVNKMNEAVRIALNVDSALYGVRPDARFRNGFQSSDGAGASPTPMEIGNVQSSRTYPRRQGSSNGTGMRNQNRRQQDVLNGACYVCHKNGCRARFHDVSGKSPQANNWIAMVSDDEKKDHGDQEN